jgi:hypothetical protein
MNIWLFFTTFILIPILADGFNFQRQRLKVCILYKFATHIINNLLKFVLLFIFKFRLEACLRKEKARKNDEI